MKEKDIEYQEMKVGNKKIKTNLPKGMLSNKEIKQIEKTVEEIRKEIDKKLEEGSLINEK